MVNSLKAEDIDKLLMEESKSHIKDVKSTAEVITNGRENCTEIESSLKLSNDEKECRRPEEKEVPKDSKSDTKTNNNEAVDDVEDNNGEPHAKLTSAKCVETNKIHDENNANSERCSKDDAKTKEPCDDQINEETSSPMCDGVNTEVRSISMIANSLLYYYHYSTFENHKKIIIDLHLNNFVVALVKSLTFSC